ncbi:nucleoplasmin-like protein isoform X3 [Ctenocephalides felis]|uniref:nucleoplasmin-like protein isoform X2 n=1 Tax=Ctenocephalides felis TaxID=7515 RepID=UPI000E6E295E|nr:nucleoplasmin-like protein isoform X2 [Ctenocephalides felis]XP_026462315.1 nucleoplasmin-like protein isoform X3 [Ctenocephalides felis]
MADEYFYGITLSGAGATEVWDPETKAEEYPRTNKLVLRQALLGHEAKEGEYNVVQVETMSIRDTVKTPVAVLKVGESRQCRLDLEFPDYPVTFTLIQGSGPVHLHGQHLFGALVEEFEDMDEMEEELLDEEEDEDQADEDQEEEDGPKKKAKLANNAKGKAGAPKNKKK